MDSPIAKWKRIEKSLLLGMSGLGTAAIVTSAYMWGLPSILPAFLGLLCLALGFKITELLVAILTGVRKANPTAVSLLFLLKFAWWGGLFWGSKHAPQEWQRPFALGLGAFLLSLVFAGVMHYGIPKISPPNDPGPP